VAYQSVVWNLAIGGPDEVASVLVGSKGSATVLFAQRLDQFFDAITAAAEAIPAAQPASSGLASPANILSLSAIMLLLGTVGVLVVCRLALAALLILGPIFIVLALFASTRGLFEGWLKSVVTFALVPLLTVVIGSGALIALEPMVASLNSGGAEISLHTAVSVLVASVVYVSLMMVAFKVAATLTRSWRLGKSGEAHRQSDSHSTSESRQMSSSHHMSQQTSENPISDRVRTTVASLSAYREAGRLPDATMLSLRSQWSPAELTALPLQNGASRHDANLEFRMKGPVGKLPREMVR
jgi:type IV secretion system protein VirB6